MKTHTLVSTLIIAAAAILPGCAATRADGNVMRGETAGEYIDDAAVTARVNSLIVEDRGARFFKIDVTTMQGDVVLQGFVNNQDTQDRLVAQIREVRGVKSVKSLLRIEEKTSLRTE